MIFGLFGSKKTQSLSDLLTKYALRQQVMGNVAKAQSLEKLGRSEEAQRLVLDTEKVVRDALANQPTDKQAHVLAAIFYEETGNGSRAEAIIEELLVSKNFLLTEDEQSICQGTLQKLRRERPLSDRKDGPTGFTTIYCCQNCGRLHNFVSMPCPNCDWRPQTLEEAARSIALSNSGFEVPALLLLAREMAKGRAATEVVRNLVDIGHSYLQGPIRSTVEKVLFLLNEEHEKHHRNLGAIRVCSECGHRIVLSTEEKCEECSAVLDWPDAVRALVCMDNLLWLFEQRLEVSQKPELSELVCVLVAMTNNLLRKQETPSESVRSYCLSLLERVGAICDLNRGAVIDTNAPKKLQIYLVKSNLRDDSNSYGIWWFSELEHLVQKMDKGIKV